MKYYACWFSVNAHSFIYYQNFIYFRVDYIWFKTAKVKVISFTESICCHNLIEQNDLKMSGRDYRTFVTFHRAEEMGKSLFVSTHIVSLSGLPV